MIFIGPLGTMGEKSHRLEKLCAWLAERTGGVEPSLAARAGLLAKADLVSGMVGEFDTLQGIMGGIYAENAGENTEVAQAIRGQYLPTGPDSPLPQTMAGCILSVADKADTLAGCFGLDMIPTGVADPNGLRRCALGIIRIFLDRNIKVPVSSLFIKARELYGQKKWKLDPAVATARLMEFLEGRLRNYFIGKGYDTVLVNAVIAAGMDNLPACAKRLDAITAFAKGPQFEKSVQTIKRVSNIAKKAEDSSLQSWQKDLLSEEAEKQLSEILEKLLPELDASLEAGEYERAFAILAELRLPVDNFFDNTMVMCEENALRRNRLGMLNAIGSRYGKIADFLALQV